MDIVKSPLLTEKIDTGSCGSNNPAKFPEKTGVVRSTGSLGNFIPKSGRRQANQ